MKKIVASILIILISILAVLTYNTSIPTPNISYDTYLVTRIIDGDTFEINYNSQTETVRLLSVDTPETVHPTIPVEDYGKEASSFTTSELLNKYISLEFDSQERDPYNRFLAYVYIDGKMFNKTLLEKGLAQVTIYPPNTKYADEFIEIEKTAKANKIGMWENFSDNTVSEINAKYIANSSTKKIHLLSCSYAKNISSYNKVYFDNLEYPLNDGYTKCSTCIK